MVITNHKLTYAFFALLISVARALTAAEPNQTFATATLLPAGQLSVSDSLFAGTLVGSGNAPDTLIGSLDLFGQIDVVNDDDSPYGNGRASALVNIPTNSGTIDFLVTGYGDDNFIGLHDQFGDYEYELLVYDVFGDLVDTLTGAQSLAAESVDRITLSDAAWIGGDYTVFLDNAPGATLQGGDVDFFRFSGLASGTSFTVVTEDSTSTGIDTFLGWFSATGSLLDSNDDYEDGGELLLLSKLTGTVPANGQLYFAVTGYGDDDFMSVHEVTGDYELVLTATLANTGTPGDFSGDGFVNAADYTRWRDGLGTTYTAADYNLWRNNFGPSAVVAADAVPEPTALALLLVSLISRWAAVITMRGPGCNRTG